MSVARRRAISWLSLLIVPPLHMPGRSRKADPHRTPFALMAPRLARLARRWVAGQGRNLNAGPVQKTLLLSGSLGPLSLPVIENPLRRGPRRFGVSIGETSATCSQAARQRASTSLPTTPKTVVTPFTLRTPKRWIAAPRGERYAVVGRSNRRSPCDPSRPERLPRSGCAVPDNRLVRFGDAMRPAAAAGRRERGERNSNHTDS